jgi:rubrerythrin
MEVTVWVCKICGEAYITTTNKPARCPFCGAYEEYLVDSKKYDDTGDWDVELNELDKANAEKALGVEVSNALFYKCSVKKDKADLEDSHEREERAIKFYGEAADAAENPRVKEIFQSFVQVETDHLKLSEERLK